VQQLEESRRRLTADRSLALGVHVRHGDKVWEEAPRVALAAYVDAIRERLRQMRGGGGGARGRETFVFLATDSTKVVQDLRTRAPELDLRVYAERRNEGVAFSLLTHTHAVNVTRYALDALVNLYTLADCSAIVATFSSNFGRVAIELQLSRYFEALKVCEGEESRSEKRRGEKLREDKEMEADKDDARARAREEEELEQVLRCAAPYKGMPPLSLDFPWYADP